MGFLIWETRKEKGYSSCLFPSINSFLHHHKYVQPHHTHHASSILKMPFFFPKKNKFKLNKKIIWKPLVYFLTKLFTILLVRLTSHIQSFWGVFYITVFCMVKVCWRNLKYQRLGKFQDFLRDIFPFVYIPENQKTWLSATLIQNCFNPFSQWKKEKKIISTLHSMMFIQTQEKEKHILALFYGHGSKHKHNL